MTMKTDGIKIFLSLSLLLLLSITSTHAEDMRLKVISQSMYPTLDIGDNIEIIHADNYKPERGSIVAYYPTVTEKKLYIHRCIAVEGDNFSIKHGRVYINNKELVESYTVGDTTYEYYNTDKIKIEGIVPPGVAVVLGDNRNNAADSRCFGYIPFKRIYGFVRKI